MKHDIAALNKLYKDAEDKDSSLFSEMKSNVLLVNSEHYKQIERSRRSRVEDREDMNRQRVRITKNHIYRIMQKYKNGIMGLTPDLMAYPANESELQDKKSAELYNSTLEFGKNRYRINDKKEDWCEDYCDIGEVACKIYWDKNKGDIRAYKQALDEQDQPIFLNAEGQPTLERAQMSIDPMTMMPVEGAPNKPLPDTDQPIFSGDFVFETIFPANLLRDPETESMDESPYLVVRKMVDVEEAKMMILATTKTAARS